MNTLRSIWRRICLFFVDPEFDALLDPMTDEEMALIRRIESRRQDG